MEYYDICDIDFDKIIDDDRSNAIDYEPELSFLGRCKKGTINLACAKTGVGKSLFLRQFAACMCKNYNILYISLENDMATDVEHFKVCKTLYPYFKSPNTLFVYSNSDWDFRDHIKIAREFDWADLVCIDGLETTIDLKSDNGFEEYKARVKLIRKCFPNACLWFSWQMGRKFETGEPQIEDIAFSYQVARLAYCAVAIYNDKGVKFIKNIKCRGGNYDTQGVIVWGEKFQIVKEKAPSKGKAKADPAQILDLMNQLTKNNPDFIK